MSRIVFWLTCASGGYVCLQDHPALGGSVEEDTLVTTLFPGDKEAVEWVRYKLHTQQ